jgi:5-oxopent-3-ene-1,2,5-tricarboxylate decarboxylase/2-hydroxyhepta-2,4-diene-1,7-dioate isomerase
MTSTQPPFELTFDMAPYRLSGTVVGTLMNHRSALAALGEAAQQAPYKAPPKAPVLFIKPRNTLAASGHALSVPEDAPELSIAGTLGLVIGRTASRLNPDDALDWVAGCTIVGDVTVPHSVFHRPSLRFNARDGFCRIGPRVVPWSVLADLDDLSVRTFVDGSQVHESSTSELIRPVRTLLADVTDFMTLHPGDVLLVGRAFDAPLVSAGQHVTVQIDGIGRLETRLVAAERKAA